MAEMTAVTGDDLVPGHEPGPARGPARHDGSVAREVCSAAWERARPRLSVLVPFYRNDPCQLLRQLDRSPDGVEVVVLDDGSADDALAARVESVVVAMAIPAMLVVLSRNEGRARGRNRLARIARADQLLFLDSDMRLDGPAFTTRWLELVERSDPAVAVGGFSVDARFAERAHRLAAALSTEDHCLDAHRRALVPEKYVFTSNLCVRRDVFEAHPFDVDFSGWGWEDVEWGIRVSAEHDILHVDIPARHAGLDDDRTLLAKFEESVANFGRVVRAHRSVVARYGTYRAARLLAAVPMRRAWRPALKRCALERRLPLALRVASTKLYRAALYADVVRGARV